MKHSKNILQLSTRHFGSKLSLGPVDFRSDTVTKPCPKMNIAMAKAQVGDDSIGEDPTTNEFQR